MKKSYLQIIYFTDFRSSGLHFRISTWLKIFHLEDEDDLAFYIANLETEQV